MNVAVAILKYYFPESIKKRMLMTLFRITARAFECPVPALPHGSYARLLTQYALFSRSEAEKACGSGDRDLAAIHSRLFEQAYRLGGKIRKWLRIKTNDEVMSMGGLLYAMLGIDFRGEAGGMIVIDKCFFSDYYSSRICKLISALDEGILAGLSGGGQLNFIQRITEGKSCCQARFVPGGAAA